MPEVCLEINNIINMQIILMNINEVDVKKGTSHCSKRNEIHRFVQMRVNCSLLHNATKQINFCIICMVLHKIEMKHKFEN